MNKKLRNIGKTSFGIGLALLLLTAAAVDGNCSVRLILLESLLSMFAFGISVPLLTLIKGECKNER